MHPCINFARVYFFILISGGRKLFACAITEIPENEIAKDVKDKEKICELTLAKRIFDALPTSKKGRIRMKISLGATDARSPTITEKKVIKEQIERVLSPASRIDVTKEYGGISILL